MSAYLPISAGPYGPFGLSYPLPAGLNEQASGMVDAYLKRPEGIIYAADANGTPIYMAGAAPEASYKLAGAISSGTNVSVALTPATFNTSLVGEVLILDNGSANLQEACVVTAVTAPNIVTFASVQFAHAQGAAATAGLVITEDRSLPAKRSVAQVSRGPIVNMLSVLGRFAYGRRSDQISGMFQEANLLASLQTFGGPPMWMPISLTQVDWSSANRTGEVFIPASAYLAYYSEARLKYVAGFPANSVPDPIIRATAAIANSLQSNAQFGGQVKSISAGSFKIERFFASNLDTDTLRLLDAFKARTFF